VAVSNQLHFSSEVLYLALFSFFWISGFDIIYALLDLDFDRKHGIHSIPAWLGKKGALGVAAATHLGAILALLPLIQDVFSGLAVLIASFAIFLAYLPIIPLPQRFFPLSAISGIAGALSVLL
jgi:4-hydroxybenzoate polyprenyltransferase